MRVERLNIKGINRNIGSPDNDDGFCSELVNLKPQNGLRVAPAKTIKSANLPYKKVYLHKINRTTNHIGVQDDATGVRVVQFNPETGKELYKFNEFTASSDIHIALLNNTVIISDKTAVKEYIYNYYDSYTLLYDGLDFDVVPHIDSKFYEGSSTKESILAPTEAQYLASCQAIINKFRINNKEFCEGTFQYAFTLTLYDGSETGMYGFGAVATEYAENPSVNDPAFHPSRANSFIAINSPNSTETDLYTHFYWDRFYQKHIMTIGENTEILNKYKDYIKKVNLYVSVPITRMPITETDVSFNGVYWKDGKVTTLGAEFIINAQYPKDSGIEKALLYRQKSWSFDEFCRGIQYTLEFGGDRQTTGATMEVSSSSVERAGKMYTYNNRVHFYDSVVRLKPQLGRMCKFDSTSGVYADIYVYLRTSDKENILKYSHIKIDTKQGDVLLFPDINLPDMVIFPDSRAYKMMIVITEGATIEGYEGRGITIDLTSSPAYNYSYFFGGETHKGSTILIDSVPTNLSDTYTEPNVVNVTTAGNAAVFPVEHSYRFDGNITSLEVSTQSISDAQVGQWPINVFTDNGVYALQQGDGAVLYSNIIPLTNDTCTNANTIYTRQGIAYISNGAVYLLTGRNTTKLSLLLEGDIDTYIQNNTSFLKCCGGELYDITDTLSKVPFRTFVEDATLSWCANTNELVISNTKYPYSYVYDFIYNGWYKVEGNYTMVEDNLMLSPVSLNHNSATPATGNITLSALHIEKAKSFSSVCSASFDTNATCGAFHTIALIIDGVQVSSATFSQNTKANLIVSTLCQNIGYLEDYKGTIYSTIDLSGKSVQAYNVTTGAYLFSSSFNANNTNATIPAKAIGASVSIVVNGKAYTTNVSDSSSVVTILNDLAEDINNGDINVSASVYRNRITLTAREAGAKGNDITISSSSTDNDYIYITTDNNTLKNGSDTSLTPSEYKQMIDWSTDDDTKDITIHLHTRPLHLGNKNVYKTIHRAILNCVSELRGIHNLSMYIYASNDLINYKCVAAAQRQDCTIAQITTHRVDKAYKYFVIMIGGKVNAKTSLSDIFISLQDIANSKPR